VADHDGKVTNPALQVVQSTPDEPGDPAAVHYAVPADRILRTPRRLPVLPSARVVVYTG